LLEKEEKPVSFQKSEKVRIKKNKKQAGCYFKQTGLSQPLFFFNPFCDFP